MATAVEEVLGRRLLAEKGVTGWVNVPADCVRSLARIHLHAARPPGLNEPTQAAQKGLRPFSASSNRWDRRTCACA